MDGRDKHSKSFNKKEKEFYNIGPRSSSSPASPKATPPKLATNSSSSLPRKLVRGQDVWLGKGQEQTRQILKCMWCGQSFPSLADLTVHMQVDFSIL